MTMTTTVQDPSHGPAQGNSQDRLLSYREQFPILEQTNYLRVYMAQIRRKLEPEPARPRYFITEPRMGYRFEPGD